MHELRLIEVGIDRRVERHWGRMRSLGAPFRAAMIRRDVNAARVRAGLEPRPAVQLGQLVQRARAHRANHGPQWLAKAHPLFRAAWLVHLDAGGEGIDP